MSTSTNERHVLVGHSPRVRHIRRLIDKVGACRWPVLLLGETGTGKEVVARLIHAQNPVGPFVTIDCSSMVGPLMESELFGHAKGSFTGAAAAKVGLIEIADGGTAFFDEIGELPLDLQAKLLRVLQEKEFRPVGGLHQKRSDFRIIAATNRDLAQEVEKGTFRRDLYYRLNVVNIRLAALRERKEDIPVLIAHFLDRYGTDQKLAPEVVDALLAYDWPGNIRELENCVQHLVALNSGTLLQLHHLPSPLQHQISQQRTQVAAAAAAAPALPAPVMSAPPAVSSPPVRMDIPGGVAPPILPLAEVEKRAILEALAYTKGDRAVAAHLLGIGRTTLYRKLKEYSLED